jgi:hypothetical protein
MHARVGLGIPKDSSSGFTTSCTRYWGQAPIAICGGKCAGIATVSTTHVESPVVCDETLEGQIFPRPWNYQHEKNVDVI